MRWPQTACSLRKHRRKTSSVAGIVLRVCRVHFVTRQKLERSEYALRRGNPPTEPTPIPLGWTNTALLRHVELSCTRGARYREKKCRASRGVGVFERWTSWEGRRSGFHGWGRGRGVVEDEDASWPRPHRGGEPPLLEETAITRSAAAGCGESHPGALVQSSRLTRLVLTANTVAL